MPSNLLWKLTHRDRLPIGSPRYPKLRECASKLDTAIKLHLSKMRQVTRFIQTMEDKDCRLFELPEELLLEILEHLPHSSLYLLRQTCTTFRRLIMDAAFRDFNLDFSRPLDESSCITQAGHEQRRMIRDVLARRTHCKHCNQSRENGRFKEKMMELYEPMFCRGCDMHHAALFFAPGERRSKSLGGGLCLGRNGLFRVCSHYSVDGETLRYSSLHLHGPKRYCSHPSHWHRARSGNYVEDRFPQPPTFIGRASERSSRAFCVSVKTTVLLLEIDPCKIDLELVRYSLKKVARSHDGEQLCQHISLLSETVLGSLVSDACTCLSDQDTRCDEHCFVCRHCGAIYDLEYQRRETGSKKVHVYLSMGVDWQNMDLLTPLWLFNLDFDGPYMLPKRRKKKKTRHPVFDKEMKHVLWCDSPGCATGLELRWMRMVKTVYNETRGCRKVKSTDKFDLAEFSSSRWLSLEYDAFYEARSKYGDSPAARPVFWR
ncbi:hypothetical protein BHE90_002191 [Fusarium euwallaceae]|uniref:F-box domain-containing protein n=2 Tax=Fusarium solani species complex TaxID=232080 RepID=A0A430M5D4_9HYPO|nr:hypothetical protein BHE90_002191 [Fusarium euwallaceae]